MFARFTEILVGVFMLLFFAAMFILAMRVSNLSGFTGNQGYEITAAFENIGGLKVRSKVSAGGVRVGRVTDIRYDSEDFEAVVTMKIDEKFDQFPLDTSASIYTAGLLGEQYIGLEPGSDIEFLEDGHEIELTQSAVVLEKLIGQVVFSRSGQQ